MTTRLGRLDAFAVTRRSGFSRSCSGTRFPLFEQLRATDGVSNAVVGGAFTGFLLVYAAMQFPRACSPIGSTRFV